MISATFTSMILSGYEESLAALASGAVLYSFVPMLMDTAGNAGGQSSVTVIRSLALGDVELKDVFRILWKELRAALLGGEHQWLVAMFLRPECPSNIFTTGHHISALVVKTNDRLMASHLRPQGSRLIFCQIHPLSPLVIKA